MAFWSGETIAANPTVIEEFNKEQIDCNSYTIKMGDTYFRTVEDGNERNKKDRLKPGETFTIPSNQFAFLLSKEKVRIHNNIMGFISMRTHFKFQGLINVSGFNVDPGYYGKLLFAVYNAGSLPIHISENEPIFKIWFAELDVNSYEIFNKGGITDIDNRLTRDASNEIISLRSLSEKIRELDVKIDKEIAAFSPTVEITLGLIRAVIIGVAIGLVVAYFKSSPVELDGIKPPRGAANNLSTPATPGH